MESCFAHLLAKAHTQVILELNVVLEPHIGEAFGAH
jgi:hypothetical protein